jgi:hypothetical protein
MDTGSIVLARVDIARPMQLAVVAEKSKRAGAMSHSIVHQLSKITISSGIHTGNETINNHFSVTVVASKRLTTIVL